jgi:hypothetical protein
MLPSGNAILAATSNLSGVVGVMLSRSGMKSLRRVEDAAAIRVIYRIACATTDKVLTITRSIKNVGGIVSVPASMMQTHTFWTRMYATKKWKKVTAKSSMGLLAGSRPTE